MTGKWTGAPSGGKSYSN